MVVDQYSARAELLECAAKTMYGSRQACRLVGPPFEVESHLNESIRATAWVAAIIGRMYAFKHRGAQQADHELFEISQQPSRRLGDAQHRRKEMPPAQGAV